MTSEASRLSEIFMAFLRLGCMAFGGPVAHLSYFRDAFVTRRKWLSESEYLELIALCQTAPGPSSSQLGFAIGWSRGGPAGALAAWLGFTLPSALLMIAAAYGVFFISSETIETKLLGGLLVAAAAVVAKAVLGMARSLGPDSITWGIVLFGAFAAMISPGSLTQVAVIFTGAGIASMFRETPGSSCGADFSTMPRLVSLRTAFLLMVVFLSLLAVSLLLPFGTPAALIAKHYQAGALVFGGGHVVLPLLHESIVATGMLDEAHFFAGYGAAQTLPGPLFTLAAFTGTVGGGGWATGIASLVAIFLPGLLLVAILLPVWVRYRSNRWIKRGLRGANGAVVGLLAAALIGPVSSNAIQGWADLALASAAFVALQIFKVPALLVVVATGLIGIAL